MSNIIPKDVWPSKWQQSYVVDVMLDDRSIISSLFVKPDGEIWGIGDQLGEPGSLQKNIEVDRIIAVRLKGGWRDYAGIRKLFPHKWLYKKGYN